MSQQHNKSIDYPQNVIVKMQTELPSAIYGQGNPIIIKLVMNLDKICLPVKMGDCD